MSSSFSSGGFFIVVPYAEKDAAKNSGARFDAYHKMWYIPSDFKGDILRSFRKWLPIRIRSLFELKTPAPPEVKVVPSLLCGGNSRCNEGSQDAASCCFIHFHPKANLTDAGFSRVMYRWWSKFRVTPGRLARTLYMEIRKRPVALDSISLKSLHLLSKTDFWAALGDTHSELDAVEQKTRSLMQVMSEHRDMHQKPNLYASALGHLAGINNECANLIHTVSRLCDWRDELDQALWTEYEQLGYTQIDRVDRGRLRGMRIHISESTGLVEDLIDLVVEYISPVIPRMRTAPKKRKAEADASRE